MLNITLKTLLVFMLYTVAGPLATATADSDNSGATMIHRADNSGASATAKAPDTMAVAGPLASTGAVIDPATMTSFGSERILNACWSKKELRGNPTDKKITLLRYKPDYSPPLRTLPHHTLAHLPTRLRGSIRAVRIPDPSKKLVALTFDLCERAIEKTGYDAAIINYLRDNHIPATFYAGGKWMRSHPNKTRQLMADPLFEIGNHSWSHPNMNSLTVSETRDQVLWTQAQYELLRDGLAEDLHRCGIPPAEINSIPPVPVSFRFPYGVCNKDSLDFMGDNGLTSIQWNIVTADPWKKQTADGIARTVMQRIKPGSIIIAHANGRGRKTIDALPGFIPDLLSKGYKFVTVTQLLAEGKTIVSTDKCYESRPGDNLHYDRKPVRQPK